MAYSKEEVAAFKELIVESISNGQSLLSLENAKQVPSRATIYNWLNEEHTSFDKEFLNNYVRAREDSGDFDADNVLETAKKVEQGILEPDQARVMIDAFKWSAGVKKPKKYGKSVDVTSGGEKLPTPPPQIVLEVITPKEDE